MKPGDLIIRDPEFLRRYMERVIASVNTNCRLPDQVFQSRFRNFTFEEFDWLISPDAWPSLQELGHASSDSSVLVAVLDPDPGKHFREFSVFNWAEIPLDGTPQVYWDVLNEIPDSSPADSMWMNSEVIVWLPPSGRWAIWGERSYGICVLGLDSALAEISVGRRWRNVDEALASVLPNNFSHRKVPSEFETSFRSNFARS